MNLKNYSNLIHLFNKRTYFQFFVELRPRRISVHLLHRTAFDLFMSVKCPNMDSFGATHPDSSSPLPCLQCFFHSHIQSRTKTHTQMQLLCVMPSCKNRTHIRPTVGRVWEGDGDRSQHLAAQKQKQRVQLMKSFAPPLMAALVALSPISNPPVSIGQTIEAQKGAALFHRACIGCHDAGGNIIQPGATLFLKDLQRNGVDTEEEIYRVTYYGKGRMPGFGENCTPRGQCTFGARLQEEEIKLLAEFVKSQAEQGWPNIESYGD